MRYMLAFLLLSACHTEALAQEQNHVEALSQRVMVCAEVASMSPGEPAAMIDTLGEILAKNTTLTKEQKIELVETCFAFWAGREYQRQVGMPRV